jgi:hypothetical protein
VTRRIKPNKKANREAAGRDRQGEPPILGLLIAEPGH